MRAGGIPQTRTALLAWQRSTYLWADSRGANDAAQFAELDTLAELAKRRAGEDRALLLDVRTEVLLQRLSQDIRDQFGGMSEQEAIAGMEAKSTEFLESGGKVYLPEPVLPRS